MTENDVKRIIKESALVTNNIITPLQFHRWLLDQFTTKCTICKGSGSYKANNGNFNSCSHCEGLGVLIRTKVINNKSCINCENYCLDSQSCNLNLKLDTDDPKNHRCAAAIFVNRIPQIDK